MHPFLLFLIVCWFLLISATPAQAYLDPGAGSMLLQVVLGGSAAALVVLKLCWRRLLAWLMFWKTNEEYTPANSPEA